VRRSAVESEGGFFTPQAARATGRIEERHPLSRASSAARAGPSGRAVGPGCWGRSRVLRRITSPVAESMATISNIGGSLAGARRASRRWSRRVSFMLGISPAVGFSLRLPSALAGAHAEGSQPRSGPRDFPCHPRLGPNDLHVPAGQPYAVVMFPRARGRAETPRFQPSRTCPQAYPAVC
jgi:hypothetical protein